MNAQTIADKYGVHEENGLFDPDKYYEERANKTEFMSLGQLSARGGRVTRLRFLTSENMGGGVRGWDVSYCHGELPDGTPVSVYSGPIGVFGNRRTVMGALIEWAKQEGVYAKGLGLLNQGNWSVLYG